MRNNDLVWYACYGSNLSYDRFLHYIQGGWYEGKWYEPCSDPTPPRDSRIRSFQGRMYFANRSRWEGKGAAFFDPDGEESVIMRLYLITREQLAHVKTKECDRAEWYGREVRLGEEDGIPVITLTSVSPNPFNAPCARYVEVIRNALIKECGISEQETGEYLNRCLKGGITE